MHSSMLLGAIMALGALAVPVEERDLDIIKVMEVVTVTVTGDSKPTAPPAPANNGGGFLQPKPSSSPSKAPPPAPSPSTSSSNGAPVSGSTSQEEMIQVVAKWRQAYGLEPLPWNGAVYGNTCQVGQGGNGVQEVHQLVPGMAMGQVITPGQCTAVPANQPYSPFELAYLAWLCECPNDPELQPDRNNGISPCQEVQNTLHMEYSDTGHHDILVSPNWSGFACCYTPNPSANQQSDIYQGLWVCDYTQ